MVLSVCGHPRIVDDPHVVIVVVKVVFVPPKFIVQELRTRPSTHKPWLNSKDCAVVPAIIALIF